MQYRVNYKYDGYASAIVEAKNEEQARERFFEGEFEEVQDNSENYEIQEVITDRPSVSVL
jgi:hypothetical protein